MNFINNLFQLSNILEEIISSIIYKRHVNNIHRLFNWSSFVIREAEYKLLTNIHKDEKLNKNLNKIYKELYN